jgi:hypothetical protein
VKVSGLCKYRLQRVKELNPELKTDEDVIMWALDAAIEVGWLESDAHLLGTDKFFEED